MLVLTDESNFSAIGNALRSVTGVSSTYLPSEMADAVSMLLGADLIAQGLPIYAKGFTSSIISRAFVNMCVDSAEFPNCLEVKDSAFQNCKSMTVASFPECRSVSDHAFAGCNRLSSIDFTACEYVGSRAFQLCSALTEVTFPACTTVDGWAFESCTSMTSINLPECSLVSDGVFQYDVRLAYVSLPKCEYIRSIAFNGCSALRSIDLPVCSTISQYAFGSCVSLLEVSLPSCRTISEGAFYSCVTLSSLSLPECVTIYNKAFGNCRMLAALYAPNVTTIGTNTDTAGNGTFQSCSMMSVAYVPNLVNALDRAFCGCVALSDVTLSNCEKIGTWAFAATKIPFIDIPKCTIISNLAFSVCNSTIGISAPLCRSIGDSAFWGCTKLSGVYFPECSYVGNSTFRITDGVSQFFSGLGYADFPKCTFLGQCAFVCRDGMSYAHFPMLSSVQFATFWGCSGLSDVTFQNCWSIVGHGSYGAFERAGMSVVSLPTCRYIGDRAFMSCYSLMSLYLTGGSYVSLPSQRALWSTPLSLSTYTGDFGSIYVPASMLTGYQGMANWSVYSSRFVGMTLSVGDTVSAFSSYDLIGPVGVSMGYQNVEEGKLNLNTFSGGHEGFNIELSDLEKGKDYTLEFDLKFIDTQFFSTNQYCVGFMVTADKRTNYTEYTTWPNNITRDNNEHHYTYTFMASSDKMYLSFALDGLSDRNQSMTITNIVVRESEWVV